MQELGNYWLLPDDVIELMPDEAVVFEKLRQSFLQYAKSWGYVQVVPSLVEFLDSFLAVDSKYLTQQTWQINDCSNQQSIAVRADITSQIARIDASYFACDKVCRYLYVGEVLRACGDNLKQAKNPIQAGVALYGVEQVSGDIEIISLLLSFVQAKATGQNLFLNLGHSGLFAGLVEKYNLDLEKQTKLKTMLFNKQFPSLNDWLISNDFADDFVKDVRALTLFVPDSGQMLDELKKRFLGRLPCWDSAIKDLKQSCDLIAEAFDGVGLQIDLSLASKYGYHNGLLFDLYFSNCSDLIASGGRYDNLGSIYGKGRFATGFNLDLLNLAGFIPKEKEKQNPQNIIWRNKAEDFFLADLKRKQGQIVIFEHKDCNE